MTEYIPRAHGPVPFNIDIFVRDHASTNRHWKNVIMSSHMHLRTNAITTLDRYISHVCHERIHRTIHSVTEQKTVKISSSTHLYRNISSTHFCTYPCGIEKDTKRVFRSKLDCVMQWKVSRESFKLVSKTKTSRRMAQIESMKKLYLSGGNRNFQQNPSTIIKENGVKNQDTNMDDDSILKWIDNLN